MFHREAEKQKNNIFISYESIMQELPFFFMTKPEVKKAYEKH